MPNKATDLLKTASAPAWKRIGTQRRAGLLAPLFFVYSRDSIGVGTFEDLKKLVELCRKSACSILQLLPMNEIGSTFCPYDAVSSFALEPFYISVESLTGSKDKPIKAKIESLRRSHPAGSGYVDYAMRDAKRDILWDIYLKDKEISGAEFEKFSDITKYWLGDFALYKVLKAYHGGKPWYEWPDPYRQRNPQALSAFLKEHEKEALFQKWLQWVAFNQFREAKEYAAVKGVLIKGDLPILISRDSADVWAHPEFFKLDFAAGAPPDMYCFKGQRWGMPTYNWDEIADDGFKYLKEKLGYARNFYDILRVDHVVGLFRIWSIPGTEPPENEGLNGFFDPRDEAIWQDHGRAILSVMLENTDMLLCAEDLGMIPASCPETLKDFGMPGNDVQRWVKDWQSKHDFLEPDGYRQLSVAMLSTHDTTNWAAWWENEAGTVDEALFQRKCRERGIDFKSVRERLFDFSRSRHGRLRWLDSVTSKDLLARVLGRGEEEIMDFIDMYENTYHEKEKLWKHLGLKGPMREKSDENIASAALGLTLGSNSIFCIELITDYLYAAGMFKGDPYQYRINKPGTIAKTNWSLTSPVPLEELLSDSVSRKIRALVGASGRVK